MHKPWADAVGIVTGTAAITVQEPGKKEAQVTDALGKNQGNYGAGDRTNARSSKLLNENKILRIPLPRYPQLYPHQNFAPNWT
jgi:hypothetical protein